MNGRAPTTGPSQAGSRGGAATSPKIARLALLCGVAVAAIFGAYEVAERLWLGGASSSLLRALHLIRGIGSSVIIGSLVAWYLLRRAPRVLPSVESGLDPGGTATGLSQAAAWFISMRWVVVVLSLCAAVVGTLFLKLMPRETFPGLLATLGMLAAANFAFARSFARIKRVGRFLVLQVVVDLLLLTTMLHFSGGIENPFSRVYIFHIVLVAILLRPRWAYGLTGLASALLAALALAEAGGWLRHYPIALFPYSDAAGAEDYAALYIPFVLGKVSSCLLVFWVTAYFTILVAKQLRYREAQLRGSAQEILASERRLHTLVDSMGMGLLLWSAEHRLLWSNRLAREWFGFRDGNDGGPCPLASRAPSGSDTCTDCATARALSTGVPIDIERPHPGPDGQGRTLRIRAIPLRGGDARTSQVLELVEDVTERKAMEMEVLQATKLAVLGRVAAGLAHEIGNPIASMAARLELMEQESDPRFLRDSVRLLRNHFDRILRLLDSIRRFGRPAPAPHAVCDVMETLEQVLIMVRADPGARNVDIQLRGLGSLPVVTVRCFPDQLIQVFLNLALNALDAMPGGGRLLVDVRVSDGEVRVGFADTGCGLSEEVKANLFRPFFTTKETGTGLGLFLSNKIVCEHGGTLRVSDEPGGGTRFEVVLPLALDAARRPEAEDAAERSHRG